MNLTILFVLSEICASKLYRLILNNTQLVNFHVHNHLSVPEDYDAFYSPLLWIHQYYSHLLLNQRAKTDDSDAKGLGILLAIVEARAREIVKRVESWAEGTESYGIHTMQRLRSKLSEPAPLLPFNRALARHILLNQLNHKQPIPQVHLHLLLQLEKSGLIGSRFITVCARSYERAYKHLMRTGGEGNLVHFPLSALDTPKCILDNLPLFSKITSCWLRVWLLSTLLSHTNINPDGINSPTLVNYNNYSTDKLTEPINNTEGLPNLLIESFKRQNNELEQKEWKDMHKLEYSVEFSCLFIDYLIVCMRFALKLDLLSVQEHSGCLEQIQRHRQITDYIVSNTIRSK